MKRNIRTIPALLLVLVMTLGMAACGSQKAPEPTATPEPELVYQADFVSLNTEENQNFNALAYADDGIYASCYEVLRTDIPEGVTPEYEGQYDVYGTRLYFLGYDGSVKRLEGYEALPPAENTENHPNFSSGCDLAGAFLNPEGGLTVLEQRYTNWYDGDESAMYEEGSSENWHYENQYLIRRLNADGSAQGEASPVDFDANNSYLGLYNSTLDSAGNVLAISDTRLVAIAPDGSIAYTIECSNYLESMVRLRDGRLAVSVWGNSGMEALPLDEERHLLGEALPLPSNAYNLISGGGDYDLYYTDGANLCGYQLDSKESVKVLNWLNCDVNGDSMNRINVSADGTVRGLSVDWTSEPSETSLVTLRRVPADTIPKKENLTLAAMYVDFQTTNQIIRFNRSSETCRIQVLDYSQYNTEEDYQAGLTKLTTEILAGNMPDILSLRQLPYRQLAAKGLLEDLYPYLDADEELSREDYFPTVMAAIEADGKLCQAVPFFSIMTLLGAESVVGDKPGWTYEQFDAALASMPEGCEPLDYYTTRDDILQTLMYLDMDDFVDWTTGKCSFDSQEFIDLLNFAKRFPAKFDWDSYEWTEGDDALSRIADGRQMLMATSISNLEDVMYNDMYFGGKATFIGYPSNNGVGNMLYLGEGFGMSSSCKNKQAAWEFLRTIMTEEYQSTVWGLPVNVHAFEKRLEKAMTPEYQKDADGNFMLDENGERIEISRGGVGFADGTVYDVYAMTQEQADRIMELINTTTRAYEANSSIYQIAQEQSQAFFAGQKSAEDVARLVQSKANIYVNEQR